jgi:hypothetical protein
MKNFKLWTLPNPSVVGSTDKWIEVDTIRAKNRKEAVLSLKGEYWTEELKEKQKAGKGKRTFLVPFKLRLV